MMFVSICSNMNEHEDGFSENLFPILELIF